MAPPGGGISGDPRCPRHPDLAPTAQQHRRRLCKPWHWHLSPGWWTRYELAILTSSRPVLPVQPQVTALSELSLFQRHRQTQTYVPDGCGVSVASPASELRTWSAGMRVLEMWSTVAVLRREVRGRRAPTAPQFCGELLFSTPRPLPRSTQHSPWVPSCPAQVRGQEPTLPISHWGR